MRELEQKEIDEVNGGFGVIGAAIGAVVGGGSAYLNGASTAQIVGATALGALSGFAGGLAGSAAAGGAIVRTAWGAKAVGAGIASGAVGSASAEDDGGAVNRGWSPNWSNQGLDVVIPFDGRPNF